MYLLDTNIVSLLDRRKRSSSPPIVDWIERNGKYLFLSSMTIAELESGWLKLRRRRQEKRAEEIAGMIAGIELFFVERILPMDSDVARAVAEIQDFVLPRVLDLSDLIIAATAKVHGLVTLTHNSRHFQPTGLSIVDPLVQLPPDVIP